MADASTLQRMTATARIGPNAIIRVAEALDAIENRALTARIFANAHIADYLSEPPSDMVAESQVTDLHKALNTTLGLRRARSVSWIAGVRTADYLLAHRIPKPVQRLLKVLPARLGARVMIGAIARNAWTFAGSGTFAAAHGHPTIFKIADCPICRGAASAEPYCDFYAGTFERLFAVLVHPQSKVTETACQAKGDAACTFEVRWKH